jgi:hypothetical protein
MRPWDWFDAWEVEALRRSDAKRARLARLHHEAYDHREKAPDRALGLIAEGRALAEALREPWWALYYDHYRVHALLHFKQDYRDVLDLAVRNTLEVRKHAYAEFPRRLLIHDDLVSAYTGIDPAGYAGPIREALAYLDREAPATGEDRYMLLGGQRQFAVELGDLGTAEAAVRRTLELADADEDQGMARHFAVFTYAGLAEIAWRRGDWEVLAEAAAACEEVARQVGHQVEQAGALMWQALAARHGGDEGRAGRLYRQSAARMARLRMPPDASYFDAECAFHELAGQLDRALRVREVELATVGGKGRLAYECQGHIKLCRLKARLGRLTDADLTAARAAARRLRLPAAPLAELEHLRAENRG